MRHLMIDIETLGTKPGSVITQIAAVQFDLKTGKLGETFNEKISIQSCLNIGLQVDEGSLEFWSEQPQGNFNNLFKNTRNISEVLYLFRVFVNSLKPSDLEVWGNSNRFDLGILENAYNKINQDKPWNFRNERDVRTLVSFNPSIKEKHIKSANNYNKHDALDDCMFQIDYVVETYNSLNQYNNKSI